VQKPSAGNYKLVEQTIALWQRRGWRELSPEEARQIAENVTGFFRVVASRDVPLGQEIRIVTIDEWAKP
jgi:hypothetical protein